MRANFLLVARAIDLPNEVFPTPGGPTKQRTGAFNFLTLCWTARYSNILSLTSSKPKWSSLRISIADFKSVLTLLRFFQGIPVSQSKYDRTTDASADIGDICLNLLNSFLAFFKASLDMPAFSISPSS